MLISWFQIESVKSPESNGLTSQIFKSLLNICKRHLKGQNVKSVNKSEIVTHIEKKNDDLHMAEDFCASFIWSFFKKFSFGDQLNSWLRLHFKQGCKKKIMVYSAETKSFFTNTSREKNRINYYSKPELSEWFIW